eukprot:4117672-Prymnesium_polylepis.1
MSRRARIAELTDQLRTLGGGQRSAAPPPPRAPVTAAPRLVDDLADLQRAAAAARKQRETALMVVADTVHSSTSELRQELHNLSSARLSLEDKSHQVRAHYPAARVPARATHRPPAGDQHGCGRGPGGA